MDDDQTRRRQNDFGSEQAGRFGSTSAPFADPSDAAQPAQRQPQSSPPFTRPEAADISSAGMGAGHAAADDANGDNLPLWLQSFGESTGDTSGGQDSRAAGGWGGAQSPRPAGGFAAAASDGNHSTTSFLSDDDLPEWLRSLSTPDTPAAPVVLGGGEIHAMSTPSVSRVWIADHEVPEATSGGMVFASIVQTIDTRPDSRLTTRVIEPELGDSMRGAPSAPMQQQTTLPSSSGDSLTVTDAKGSKRRQRREKAAAVEQQAPVQPAAATPSTARPKPVQQPGGGRLRLYLAAALLCVLIVLAALILQ